MKSKIIHCILLVDEIWPLLTHCTYKSILIVIFQNKAISKKKNT